MQRVALVGTIKDGKESDLWRAQDQLGSGSFNGGNMPGFETFIGSGFFVMVIDAPVQDFQNRFAQMFNSGPMQKYIQTVQDCVQGFPSGQFLTGDQQRQQQGGNASTSGGTSMAGNGGNGSQSGGFSSADMPMAALAAKFSPGEGLKTFTEENNSGRSGGQMGHGNGQSGRMPQQGGQYQSGAMHGSTGGRRDEEMMQTPPMTGPGQVGTGQSGRS